MCSFLIMQVTTRRIAMHISLIFGFLESELLHLCKEFLTLSMLMGRRDVPTIKDGNIYSLSHLQFGYKPMM